MFAVLDGNGFSPLSKTVNFSTPNCGFNPRTEVLNRCNLDIQKGIKIVPQFISSAVIATHHVEISYNFHGEDGVSFTRPKYRFVTNVFADINGVEVNVKSETHEYNVPRIRIGNFWFYQPLTQQHLNIHPWMIYYNNNNNHNVRATVAIQENYSINGISNGWRTIASFQTCESTVNNIPAAPNFQILGSTFNNSSWPPHFQSCVSNIQIQTQNTCNSNGFDLLVAEVDGNYNRTIRQDATRWFPNVSNRQINLQLFTQGVGEFNNVIFQTTPYIMTGGTVSPNNNGASGDRYYMIQVATLAPNWSTSVKLVRMINCKTDTLMQGNYFEILEEEEIEAQFPGLMEEFNDVKHAYAKVYPNPSHGQQRVTIEYSLHMGILKEVICVNQFGNQLNLEIRNQEFFGEMAKMELDITNISRGVHTILLNFEDGSTKPLRLIN